MAEKKKTLYLSEADVYRLILSDPTVYGYDLERKQVKAVIEAYSRVIRDSFEVDIRVPMPKIGEFYPSVRTTKGGGTYFGHPIKPSKKKKLKFRVKPNLYKKEILLDLEEGDEDDE